MRSIGPGLALLLLAGCTATQLGSEPLRHYSGEHAIAPEIAGRAAEHQRVAAGSPDGHAIVVQSELADGWTKPQTLATIADDRILASLSLQEAGDTALLYGESYPGADPPVEDYEDLGERIYFATSDRIHWTRLDRVSPDFEPLVTEGLAFYATEDGETWIWADGKAAAAPLTGVDETRDWAILEAVQIVGKPVLQMVTTQREARRCRAELLRSAPGTATFTTIAETPWVTATPATCDGPSRAYGPGDSSTVDGEYHLGVVGRHRQVIRLAFRDVMGASPEGYVDRGTD